MVVTMAWLPVFGRAATVGHRRSNPAPQGARDPHSARRRHRHGHRRAGRRIIVIPLEPDDRWFLVAAAVLAAFGAADDRFDLGLPHQIRGQLIAVIDRRHRRRCADSLDHPGRSGAAAPVALDCR
jgi:hypothetical protein